MLADLLAHRGVGEARGEGEDLRSCHVCGCVSSIVAGKARKRGLILNQSVTNRFEAVSCRACGRRVARKSRQQRYCGDRCRQYALRENKARTAIKNASGYPDSGRVTNPLFLLNRNNRLQARKSGSSLPLNVLGGYRWPNAVPVDREVLCKVIRAEIGST